MHQTVWYTWLEHLRPKAAADAHEIICRIYGSLHIYDDLSNLYLLSAWNIVVRFLFAFLYLHVVNQDICFATSLPGNILQSECDILQSPGFEVYHIHFWCEVQRGHQPIRVKKRLILVLHGDEVLYRFRVPYKDGLDIS